MRHYLPALLFALLPSLAHLGCSNINDRRDELIRLIEEEEGIPQDFLSKKENIYINHEGIMFQDSIADPDKVLALHIYNFWGLTDVEKIYQYKNVTTIDLRMPSFDGSTQKRFGLSLAEMEARIRKLDLSRFPKLYAVSFKSSHNENFDWVLQNLKEVAFMEIVINRGRNITESICNISRINTLKVTYLWYENNISEKDLKATISPCIANIQIDKFIYGRKKFGSEQNKKSFAYHLGDKIRDRADHMYYQHTGKKPHPYFKYKKMPQYGMFEILSSMKSLHEIKLQDVLIDSIPKSIGNLTQLRKLHLQNCYVSYFPPTLNKLKNLESLRIYQSRYFNRTYDSAWQAFKETFKKSGLTNIDRYQRAYEDSLQQINHETWIRNGKTLRIWQRKGWKFRATFPKVSFPSVLDGLSNLKVLHLYNVNLVQFPEFPASKKLQSLVYFGDGTQMFFPHFVGDCDNLRELYWQYTAVERLPDNLNRLRLSTFNIDNNKLTSIDNVLDAAAYAREFSYEINAIPYQARVKANASIAQKHPEGWKPAYQQDPAMEKMLDSIYYNIWSVRLEVMLKKIRNEIRGLSKDQSLEEYIAKVREVDKKYGKNKWHHDAKWEILGYLQWYKEHDFDYTELLSDNPTVRLEWRAWDGKTFNTHQQGPSKWRPDYQMNMSPFFSTDKNIGPSQREHWFVDYDFGKLHNLREVKTSSNQHFVNSILKAKNLRKISIIALDEGWKTLPVCVCELEKLESFVVGERVDGKMELEYKPIQAYKDRIELPDCLFEMGLNKK